MKITHRELKRFAHQIEDKKLVETKEILLLQDEDGNSVAHWLAINSLFTKWSTKDKEILMLKTNRGYSVAFWLAENSPTWSTDIPEILSLYVEGRKSTVEDMLIRKGRL